jgi:hypothetical protein
MNAGIAKMNAGTEKLKAATREKYAAVAHLSDRDAAAVLGLAVHSVRSWRRDQRPKVEPVRPVYGPKPVRDDVRKVTVANPASSSTALGVMTISLPKEPWART